MPSALTDSGELFISFWIGEFFESRHVRSRDAFRPIVHEQKYLIDVNVALEIVNQTVNRKSIFILLCFCVESLKAHCAAIQV